MQFRFMIAAALLAAAGTGVAVRAQQLVHVSATANDPAHAVVVTLQPGLWRAIPVAVAQGGSYDAWHAWNGVNAGCAAGPGACTQGWMWSYSIQCPGMPEVKVQTVLPGAGVAKYASATEAFASSHEHWFPIETPTPVSFWIGDSVHTDNLGGVSVRLETATPTHPALVASPGSISVLAGGQQVLDIDGGPLRAGHLHLVLGSSSGTNPGFPALHWHLPLNAPDPYLGLTLQSPNSAILVNTLGVLDAQGRSRARFVLPPNQPVEIAGLTLWHATITLAPFGISGISAATRLDLVR